MERHLKTVTIKSFKTWLITIISWHEIFKQSLNYLFFLFFTITYLCRILVIREFTDFLWVDESRDWMKDSRNSERLLCQEIRTVVDERTVNVPLWLEGYRELIWKPPSFGGGPVGRRLFSPPRGCQPPSRKALREINPEWR